MSSNLTSSASARIHLLPSPLINQISAGEVVVRPASVVKELVENSIDAGSSAIEIHIESGGFQKIAVMDDGEGISASDLKLALARHATSKFFHFKDFAHLSTYGFRGEALASIAAVSRLTLRSAISGAMGAEMGGEGMVRAAAHPVGTTLMVRDLFYNTPARRKFLRSEKSELAHIDEVVRRLALAHPALTFQLKHNGRLLRHYDCTSDLKTRLLQVSGRRFLSDLARVEGVALPLAVQGWVTRRALGVVSMQYIFINGRIVRDRIVTHAVRAAYSHGVVGASPETRQATPPFVLFLTLPATEVDINVHPTKEEVRFADPRRVHDLIFSAVRGALRTASTPVWWEAVRPASPGVAETPAGYAPNFGQLLAIYQGRYALLAQQEWVMGSLLSFDYWVQVGTWLQAPRAVALSQPFALASSSRQPLLEALGFLSRREGSGVVIEAVPLLLHPVWSEIASRFEAYLPTAPAQTLQVIRTVVGWLVRPERCFTRTEALACLSALEALYLAGVALPAWGQLTVPLPMSACCEQLEGLFDEC